MKTKILAWFALTILLCLVSSCMIDFKEIITGSGNVALEKRDIENFDALDVSSGLEVLVTFGEKTYLEIEADENLVELIKTDLRNRRLRIYSEMNIRRAKSKKIHITVPQLRSIEVSEAAIVKSQNSLKTDEIEIEVSSAGELELEVEARIIRTEVSSAANVFLKGETEQLHAEVSSAGKLNAFDLVSKYCYISVSSAGHAKVNTQKELNAEASSAGSILYVGDPIEKIIEKSSGGSVTPR